MNPNLLWSIAQEALQALGAHYGPAMDQTAAEAGLKSPEYYGWLLPALIFEPEPVSPARLRVRNPYTSPRLYHERLQIATGKGFLTAVAQDEYRLTESGHQVASRVVEAAYACLATLHPLPPDDLERVANLLRDVVFSCQGAPEPPGKWCLTHSQRTDPGDRAPVLVRIDQYLSDLAAYRDDAHLAAWQIHGVSGYAWEAFTCLWRGEATTITELCTKLEARRGCSQFDYEQALQALTEQGWIAASTGVVRLTAVGQAIRQAAEDATDRSFYAPWSCLSEVELEQCHALLLQFRDALL